MTVEKKREVVKNYCRKCNCAGNGTDKYCDLAIGGWVHMAEFNRCLLIDEATEEELDRALEIIGVPVELEPTAQLEQIVEDADTVIKISSKRKLESVTIYFREEV